MTEEKKTEVVKDVAVDAPKVDEVEKVHVGDVPKTDDAVVKAIEKVTAMVEGIVAKNKPEPAPASAPIEEVKKVDETLPVDAKAVDPDKKDEAAAALPAMPKDTAVILDAIQKAVDQIKPTANPANVEIAAALKELLNAVKETSVVTKSLGERVEKIEKVYNPSKSIDGDGGTEKQVVVEKKFWSNVL